MSILDYQGRSTPRKECYGVQTYNARRQFKSHGIKRTHASTLTGSTNGLHVCIAIEKPASSVNTGHIAEVSAMERKTVHRHVSSARRTYVSVQNAE